jgi:hypothetical protein
LIEFNWSGGLSCFTVLEKQLFVFFNHLLYDWARFHHEFFQLERFIFCRGSRMNRTGDSTFRAACWWRTNHLIIRCLLGFILHA